MGLKKFCETMTILRQLIGLDLRNVTVITLAKEYGLINTHEKEQLMSFWNLLGGK